MLVMKYAKTNNIEIMGKKRLSNDGKQSHQYQQSRQSHLPSTN